jgi:hypothetical protein
VPQESKAGRDCALPCSLPGHGRLTWRIVDEDSAYLRPWQVPRILKGRDLLCPTARPAPAGLNRQPEPDHQDQVRRADLMDPFPVQRVRAPSQVRNQKKHKRTNEVPFHRQGAREGFEPRIAG